MKTDPRWFKTIDNYPIVDGLPVWDYDLERGIVDFGESRMDPSYWEGWFVVRNGESLKTMNGERLWVVHPSTGEPARSHYTIEQLRTLFRGGPDLVVREPTTKSLFVTAEKNGRRIRGHVIGIGSMLAVQEYVTGGVVEDIRPEQVHFATTDSFYVGRGEPGGRA